MNMSGGLERLAVNKSLTDFSMRSSQCTLLSPNTDEFYELCKSHLKISPRNAVLQLKVNGQSDMQSLSCTDDQFEEIAKKHLEEKRKYRESDIILGTEDRDIQKSLFVSPLILFIVPDSHLKYLIPDYELSSCKKMFTSSPCHESFFGLGRLYAYEGKFNRSLELLNKAVAIYKDDLYELWNSLIRVKTRKDFEVRAEKPSFFERFWCCSSGKKCESLTEKLEKMNSLESNWGLLEMSSVGFGDIEKPEYYASQIKIVDEYYGYLAWAEVYLKKNENENFMNLINEITKKYGHNPEAYAKQWIFSYKILKNYSLSEDIVSEALLRINTNNNFQYYILFCVYLAKVYFQQKRYKVCFSFLQKKFIEHPTYPIFLYLFGKLSTKCEDFLYNGAALSALYESLRLCDEFRLGDIYYWLCKASILARLHSDAYKNAVESLQLIDKRKIKKISELTSFIQELKPNIEKINTVESLLLSEFNPAIFEKAGRICDDLQNFNKLTADVLHGRCLWKVGKINEAISKLTSVAAVSTVKMTAYFALLKILRKQENLKSMQSVAVEMISKCRNPQVPSFIWMKVNILYAKILVKLRKPGKAILLLKTLAKLLPPFPFVDIQYTKALQRASSIHELNEARNKVISSYNVYSFANYKNSFIDSFTEGRVFSKKLIEEDDLDRGPKKFQQRRGNRLATEKLDGAYYQKKTLSMYKFEDVQKKKALEIAPAENTEIMMFSVCSEVKFLYLISKISMKFNVSLNDGLCAVQDYLELLKFEKKQECREKYREKALRLYTLLLEHIKSE